MTENNAELTAIVAAATPTPWRWYDQPTNGGRAHEYPIEGPQGFITTDIRKRANAAFIVTACNRFRTLLEENEALTERVQFQSDQLRLGASKRGQLRTNLKAAEARISELEGMLCDGNHEARCCRLHKTHSNPHRGCILR